MNKKTQSLLLGLLTIFCWGSLATFGNLVIHLPPFYVLGVTFIVGSIPAWFRPREMFSHPKILLFGALGYFGYHFFLFYSFRYAPAIEANLINYMWPVILVMVSPIFFEGQKLKVYHFVGAAMAIIGSGFLVFGKGADLKPEYIVGYLLALGAAVTWPTYTIGKKKLPPTSVWAIGGFCLVSGILSFITHALIEPRVVLQTPDLLKLIMMGIGPFGIAFYSWELAFKHGDSRVLGALAYLTPVISTLGLIIFAGQSMVFTTIVAMVLIIGGASVGLLDFLPSKR